MKKRMIAGGVILSSLMVSCSVIHSHDDDYLTVPAGKVLVMPSKKADSPMQQAFYPIPTTRVTGKPGPVSLVPPGSRISAYQQAARQPKKKDES